MVYGYNMTQLSDKSDNSQKKVHAAATPNMEWYEASQPFLGQFAPS